MEILAAFSFESVLNIVYVALGLGMVIFFHELGHFAVAKWCNVYVERFSIGFGPVIWSWTKGETEYALSIIPFGGYVKMLGQDDIDPSQLSSEEIAEDPRSYSAKPVWQRMAIISAGVIMNIITGMMFFALAYSMGVMASPARVGSLSVGSPAWVAGLAPGDDIQEIDGDRITTFRDLLIQTALSSGDMHLKGKKADGTPFEMDITPDSSGLRRTLGIAQISALQVAELEDRGVSPTMAGSAAAKAEPPFQSGDLIRKLNGEDVSDFPAFQKQLAQLKDQNVEITVQRKDAAEENLETIAVPPNQFHSFGLTMAFGPITEIRKGSPASKPNSNGQRLQVGDKIISVSAEVFAKHIAIDPLRLPDELADLAGQEVSIRVQRGSEEIEFDIVPEDRPGWIERPSLPESSLSAPAIGVAYRVLPFVSNVAEGSAAEKAGIGNNAKILKLKLTRVEDGFLKDGFLKDEIEIDFETKIDDRENKVNWAYAFAVLQGAQRRKIEVTFKNQGSEPQTAPIELAAVDGWFNPTRGIRMQPLVVKIQADTLGQSMSMGVTHATNTAVQIYMTLQSLVRRDLSPKNLQGPLGIARVAYLVSKDGLPELLLFLGFLSVNLAVLNFLPIPVLDGGHMVFLIWEGVTRRKPTERVLVAATYVGFAFILSLMAFVLYLDIFVHWLGMG